MGLTPRQILGVWEEKLGPVDPAKREEFLERPEIERIREAPQHLIIEAIGRHRRLLKIRDHVLKRQSGMVLHKFGEVQVCGCQISKADGDKAGPTKFGKPSPSNRMPFQSDRYGGPRVRTPPAPPGTFAKGY